MHLYVPTFAIVVALAETRMPCGAAGYVIPPPVIRHFIDDFARNGRYTGFPALGIEWQKLESPTLQKALGMRPGSQKGVLVRCAHCHLGSSFCLACSVSDGGSLLQPDAVLCKDCGM